MNKPAPAEHEIHAHLRQRYSPRAFAAKPIEPETLRSLFEAARWAPSSMNEQPWRFVLARREDPSAFQALLGTLTEKNQRWAKDAGALVLVVASMRHARSGQSNRHAFHDVGLASAQLVFEATSRGLFVHTMGGFDPERARELYAIPTEFEPVVVLAVSHPGDPASLPDDLRERELAPRTRHPQASFVFEGQWGRAY